MSKINRVETGTEGSSGPANLQGEVPVDVPVSAHLPAASEMTGQASYGQNVTAFERDHPGWRLAAGFDGFGYIARRRVRGGSSPLAGRTLDELAAVVAAADRLASQGG